MKSMSAVCAEPCSGFGFFGLKKCHFAYLLLLSTREFDLCCVLLIANLHHFGDTEIPLDSMHSD